MARPRFPDVPLLSYGFRPFFLGAAVVAVLAVPYWLLVLVGMVSPASHLPPAHWHGHEMLFGYGGAVLAGFLLTATPGWSRQPPVRGGALAGLAALWFAGRVASWSGGAWPLAAALVDLAFLPALVIAITPALERAARRNLVFLPILGGLVAANLWLHLDALGLLPGDGSAALRLALDLFALLIALVGGRIVPSFTANALGGRQVRPFGLLDRVALLALLALVLADLTAAPALRGALALLAGALHLARLYGWRSRETLRQPILGVLHLGYLWLAAGLIWKGLVDLSGLGVPGDALHGLALGAIGTMTLGVMSRAALGHTGRPLVVAPAIVVGYLLISLATLARLGAVLLPAAVLPALILSGVAWCLAFALFLWIYTPILLGPRRDPVTA